MRRALHREAIRLLVWAVPAGAVVWILAREVGSFSDRPWGVLALVAPLAVAILLSGRPLVRDRRLLLGGGFLLFFLAWFALFAVISSTRVLEGRRATITGVEDEPRSNLLGLNRLGDWRYLRLFAPRAPPALDLVVITLPSFEGRPVLESRQAFAGLIASAIAQTAKGIAFDYSLEQESEFDAGLCFWIERARAAGVPVFFGYRLIERNGVWVRLPTPPLLRECLDESTLASVVGVREADGRVRLVLRSRPDDPSSPSFAARVAARLGAPEPERNEPVLIQFVAPREGPIPIDGQPGPEEVELLRDRFVLVGAFRPGDLHPTPFGTVPGVMIQAWTAHSLRSAHAIRRLDSAWGIAVLFAFCYVLTLLQASGAGARPLALAAAGLIAALIAAAALAMRFGLIWIDIGVPAAATASLALVLAGGARLQRGRAHALAAPRHAGRRGGPGAEATADAVPFDVFLSYNADDRDVVLRLREALRARGLKVWIDVAELVPGQPWQEALEDVIRTVRSAAILLGPRGLGPWEVPEMRACLEECVSRSLPVIPVLLPDAAEEPELPLFLRRFTWVDLRTGLTDAGLDRLEWGITGVKPARQRTRAA